MAKAKQVDSPKISMIPIERLIPYARNTKRHDDANVAEIAGMIREFRFMNPILVDEDYNVLAGHGRLLASRQLELSEVPCVIHSHLSKAQKRAYRIADNKLVEKSPWDDDMLSVELTELQSEDFDLSLTGFGTFELDALLSTDVVDNPLDEWQDMPEFESKDQKPHRSIIVHFLDQEAVHEFCEKIGQSITDKTKYIYHPRQEKDDLTEFAYTKTGNES